MASRILNKHQLRTEDTHARLLRAAEEVFVRDGYEGAQLAEIAAAAGRTKGAVYAHFKNKEDLFLALFEQRTKEHVTRLLGKIETCANQKERLATFREFYVQLAHNKTWPVLDLEFKLFAIRHPQSKERLRKAFEMSIPAKDGVHYKQFFGSLTEEQKARVDLLTLALGPIVSGLMLESNIETKTLTEEGISWILGQVFDAFFPTPPGSLQ
jgi:AcrR family transcriptional regulator